MLPPDRYTKTAIALHWLLVAALFAQIAFGWFLDDVPRGTPARTIYVNLHKSTGLLIGLLILARIGWRLTHPAPPLPITMPTWERFAAKGSHVLLYVCMVVMPLSGYIASNFSKYGVNFFNTVKLPPWGIDDKQIYAVFNSTHVITSFILVALIALHALAALRHLTLRDGIFNRMWPARRSAAAPRYEDRTTRA
jgi:cytochrome b561